MNFNEFAEKIKSKYPGAYDDMDNKTLAQKMVSKFPQYSDVSFDESKPDGLQQTAETIRKVEGAVGNFVGQGLSKGLEAFYPNTNQAIAGAGHVINKIEQNPIISNAVNQIPIVGAVQAPEQLQGLLDKGGETLATQMAQHGANPTFSAALGTGVQMAQEIAGAVAGGSGLIRGGRAAKAAASAADAEALANLREVPPMKVPVPQKTLALPEPTPRAPKVGEVASASAKKFNSALDGLTNKAKAKYRLAERLYTENVQQEGLKLRNPQELQTDYDEIFASRKPRKQVVSVDASTGIEQTELIPGLSRKERLSKLWQLNKEIGQNINYADPASQQGMFNLQNKVLKEIEALPGGKKLLEVRAEYGAYKQLQKELGTALQDPEKQRAILYKIAKGGMKEVGIAGDEAKGIAIGKLEKEAGKEILSPIKAELEHEAMFKQVMARKQKAEKLFSQEQRRDFFEAEKLKSKAAREKLQKEYIDSLLIKRMEADNAPALTKKQKMIQALKHLAKIATAGAVGGTTAKLGFDFFQ